VGEPPLELRARDRGEGEFFATKQHMEGRRKEPKLKRRGQLRNFVGCCSALTSKRGTIGESFIYENDSLYSAGVAGRRESSS
jgi:hypothetical protein